ncbi:MAG: DUF748 domain-containing protein, partial [Alistipes sp.]
LAFAISPVAKNYIEKHDQELLGRSIRMEKLRVNIFTGGLRATRLRIGEVQDSAAFFCLDSLDLRLRLWPLLSRRVEVEHITLNEPDVKIYQHGSNFNFDDLIAHFASDTTQVAAEPSKPWEIGIYNIAIRNGHIFYKDLQLNATWGLNQMNLTIPGVYFTDAKTDVAAVLNFAEGGSLSTQVGYDIATSDFDIGLHLKELTLDGTLPYFQQSLNVNGVTGLLSADLNLRGNIEHLLSLRVDGTASLARFALHDTHQRAVVAIDSLEMQLTEGDLGKMRFQLGRLYVAGFSTLFEMSADGNNLLALMKPSAPATTTDTAATTANPTLSIADLEIVGGRVIFRDQTLEKPFEYQISDIKLHSRDFNPAARNQLIVDARMQRSGTAKIRWIGSIDDINNQNITLWLTNLDLKDFTPYCEHFTAYPITNGNLSFHSQNIISRRYLNGTNHLDAFEPKVDKKRKELKPELHIPLKLGLYVLKDKSGHVKMDLPVKGSLDSPEFSYRKIVVKAIGNVLLKVVTSPFSFLTGHNDDLDHIDIDPQQYAFTSEQYASFDKIAKMLQEKPEMHIALTERINRQRALPLQAETVLRMDYAQHLHRADSTAAAAAQRPQLSMIEFEQIQQLDIRTPPIVAFADSLLIQRGIATQGLSPTEKAVALFSERAARQLDRLSATRSKVLTDYMRTTHNLAAPLFQLQPLDSLTRDSYTGRNRYTLSLEVDGEKVEVNEPAHQTPAAPGIPTATVATLPSASAATVATKN